MTYGAHKHFWTFRSRSPKPNRPFIMSQCYIHANLVKIHPPVHEISCKVSDVELVNLVHMCKIILILATLLKFHCQISRLTLSTHSAWLASVPSVINRLISIHSSWMASEPSVGNWLIAIHYRLLASLPSAADQNTALHSRKQASEPSATDRLIAIHCNWLASVPSVADQPYCYTLRLTSLCT